jgi:hypothetical protein
MGRLLYTTVTAGESGPVVDLSGKCDVTVAGAGASGTDGGMHTGAV